MNTSTTLVPPAAAKPQFFNFDAQAVRVVGTWEKPLFVAKDVCAVLEIGKYRDALATLEDYMKGCPVLVDTLGGPQEMATITEVFIFWIEVELTIPEAVPVRRQFKPAVVIPEHAKIPAPVSLPKLQLLHALIDLPHLFGTEARKSNCAGDSHVPLRVGF